MLTRLAPRASLAVALLVPGAATVFAQGGPSAASAVRRAITFDELASVANVTDPQLSPDGRRVLYALRTTDVEENRRATATYLLPVAGGTPRQWPDDTTRATEARWSPDGRRVAFIAAGQLWIANADGTGKRRLTTLTGGATGPVWAPTSDRVAFTSRVYPRCRSEACNASLADSIAASKVRAHVADRLLYRHWNAWDDATRSHLFVANVGDITVTDLVPGAEYDVPPGPFGGSEGYAWSPDGRELAYAAKAASRDAAWSTDVNVYTVPAAGGASRVVTAANRGADGNPVYSPDGRWLAWLSQARAGFEADRWRLMLMDRATGAARELLPRWGRSTDAFQFTDGGRTLVLVASDRGRTRLFTLALDAQAMARTPSPATLVGDMNNAAPSLSRDGRSMAWLRDAADRPAEVWVRTAQGNRQTVSRVLTHHNDMLVSRLALAPAQELWFAGANGDSVHAWFVRPPNQEAGRRYPLILLVHGGPQGAWLDQWHGRWSYAMFAAAGAAVLAVNPRGSTGFGQRFTDDVSRDWGGKAYEDLMKGVDAALVAHPWLDGARLGAAGGSYGGYMVNWIGGHTDRFKALVSHAGVFNLENMYGATEEVWFPEWEYGGPFWKDSATMAGYRAWSPHLFVQHYRTPTLLTHGELDYRVPYYESVALFTALQRQNVPSRLVVFPDEGHWIGKPQNQRLWWGQVQGWLSRYLADPKPSTD